MTGFTWGKQKDEQSDKDSDKFTIEDLKLILNAYGEMSKKLGTFATNPPSDFTDDGATVSISTKLIKRNLNSQYRVLQPDGMTQFILKNNPDVLKSVMYAFYPELSNPEMHSNLLTVIDKHIAAVRNTADTLQMLRDKLS